MRVPGADGGRRWIAAIAVAAGLALTSVVSAPHALAAGSAITGVVENTSGAPLAGVTVNVLDPNTDATDATTTTASDGTFTASVNSGTYNVEFIPQSGSGLQSYLAPDVTAGAAPLTVILKSATVVQLQGTLTDSQGNAYPNSQDAAVTFTSPLNPGSSIGTSSSGGYSVALIADQNFTANVFTYTPGIASYMSFSGLPVGTLDQSQTYNLTLPTAQLSVSVVDSSGTPITSGTVQFDGGSISPLPGLPGSSASTGVADGFPLNSSGKATVTVPNGVTLDNARVVLSNGLTIPFTAKNLTGTQSVTVTAPPSIQLQGTLTDSQGNAYPNSQDAAVTFTSPLNPGSSIGTSSSGGYSVALIADQNFTANVFTYTPGIASYMSFSGLPVGTLDQSQTYNLTLPTAQLSVSVVDSSGTPITSGTVQFDGGSISPLPGLPGSSASTGVADGFPLNSSGKATVTVPNGVTLDNARVVLSNGLTIPFTLKPLTGIVHAYIIFNETTGQVIVDDQPPVVTGTPDTSPNASGWYNAPVTITWTSIDPAPSSGTPTTPPPTTLSTDGANQTATSAPSCDPAGNCATGTVTGINLDTTPPSVSVMGVTSGGTYSTAPSPACTTTDALSGVAANATLAVTSSETTYTATCSGATDNAGNAAAPVSVSYQVIPAGYTTASLTDSTGNPIAGAAVTFRSASGSVTNAATDSNGIASATLTPGTYSVTMNYATGYQTKTITVTAAGPNAVNFSTVAVTAKVNDPDTADLATATIEHAGNTGSYGSKIPVNASGAVIFQVLPGTNTFTAWDAGGYQAQTVTISGAATVTFNTVAVTVQLNDPDGADLAAASVTHAGNTGSYGPKTAVSGSGVVTFQVLPGTNSFTAYDAGGYQTQTVTISGTATVTFATVAVTVQVNDPSSADIAAASAAHAGNTGIFGPKTPVDGTGAVTFQVLPGTNTFTAYDAGGYQAQTVTISGAATVTFATVAVTVTVLKNGSPLTTATVTHAGNTGTYGPKTAVDATTGEVVFQVLSGTNSFTAWDGSAFQSETLTVTSATSTSITVS